MKKIAIQLFPSERRHPKKLNSHRVSEGVFSSLRPKMEFLTNYDFLSCEICRYRKTYHLPSYKTIPSSFGHCITEIFELEIWFGMWWFSAPPEGVFSTLDSYSRQQLPSQNVMLLFVSDIHSEEVFTFWSLFHLWYWFYYMWKSWISESYLKHSVKFEKTVYSVLQICFSHFSHEIIMEPN